VTFLGMVTCKKNYSYGLSSSYTQCSTLTVQDMDSYKPALDAEIQKELRMSKLQSIETP